MKYVILPYPVIAKKSKRANIDPKEAFHVISKHYCQKMIMFGMCPQACMQCEPALNEMFKLDDAVKKVALMVYKARNEYAKAQEIYSQKEKAQPKEKSFMDLFDKKSENSIDNILKLVEQL